jgi:hypothetical protein
VKKKPSIQKLPYMIMLSLFSIGVFGIFSDSDINIFVKGCGLLISLQAGMVLTHYTIYKLRRKKYDSAQL